MHGSTIRDGELCLFKIYCNEQDQIRKNWIGRIIKDHPAFLGQIKRKPFFDKLSETELVKLRQTQENLKTVRIRVSTGNFPDENFIRAFPELL